LILNKITFLGFWIENFLFCKGLGRLLFRASKTIWAAARAAEGNMATKVAKSARQTKKSTLLSWGFNDWLEIVESET